MEKKICELTGEFSHFKYLFIVLVNFNEYKYISMVVARYQMLVLVLVHP